jgi:predicted DCC family thiol-disulfide oxidoreductase YuxK
VTEPAGRPVIVYDGDCSFCRAQIGRIRLKDRRDAFEYVPRQAEGLIQRFPALAEGDFNSGMRLVMPDGAIHVGADAVYEIARRMPVWKLAAWTYRVPGLRALFRWIYAWIAAHRQSLGRTCRDDACKT